MRILLQRVTRGSVSVEADDRSSGTVGEIGAGLVALVGIRRGDTEAEVRWMAEKVASIRIFEDSDGKMNRSVLETGGSVLAVSQFTLYGELAKGNRPSFMDAAEPVEAERLYDVFLKLLREALGAERVATGIFRAMMEVELVNQGPVTILLERNPPSAVTA
jgi:D-tyrosyl-tRNA(Tyr) deacylase